MKIVNILMGTTGNVEFELLEESRETHNTVRLPIIILFILKDDIKVDMKYGII